MLYQIPLYQFPIFPILTHQCAKIFVIPNSVISNSVIAVSFSLLYQFPLYQIPLYQFPFSRYIRFRYMRFRYIIFRYICFRYIRFRYVNFRYIKIPAPGKTFIKTKSTESFLVVHKRLWKSNYTSSVFGSMTKKPNWKIQLQLHFMHYNYTSIELQLH